MNAFAKATGDHKEGREGGQKRGQYGWSHGKSEHY